MNRSSNSDFIHVVIGIIKNTQDEVLVTTRNKNAHLSGYLEFPGGKLEPGETPEQALTRELKEELDINLFEYSQLIQIPYIYTDRKVFLDVYKVNKYSGNIAANESQEVYWQNAFSLDPGLFPSANHGLIRAIQLPNVVAVTPDYHQHTNKFIDYFKSTIKRENISIIHLRSHQINDSEYIQLAEECLKLCNENNTKLVLNRTAASVLKINASGLHLTSKSLASLNKRPLGYEYLVSASCHNLGEVLHATKLGLDYVFVGPVIEKYLANSSQVLGWENFALLTRESSIPVYAIGGTSISNIKTSVECGGQGIAAIRDLWAA